MSGGIHANRDAEDGKRGFAEQVLSMTILVVDDDQRMLALLQRALGKCGYTVITSNQAQEALAMLPNIKVDLIILDVAMPGMDGHEFCRIVRNQKDRAYIPIIFLTARTSVDDVATGFIAGADDYLTKPIHLNELIEAIQKYVM
jgi:DNA-binding response OmpR family regulator